VPLAAFATPGITTIRQPMEEMGAAAAKRVLDALRDSKELNPQLDMLAPTLVLRHSTAKLH
jgi:LacI family transcriptional regulator, galactose operon repressor